MRVYAFETTGGAWGEMNPRECAYLGDILDVAADAQHTLVNALDDLADTRLDAGLLAQVGYVLAALADDDAGLLGGDEGAEGERVRVRCVVLCSTILGRGGTGV